MNQPAESPEESLEAWTHVYDGCEADDITKIEAIALDRSRFMRQAYKSTRRGSHAD